MTPSITSSDRALVSQIKKSLTESCRRAASNASPYRHWIAENMLPPSVAAGICDLPFVAPSLAGKSGKRETHNATRVYFDQGLQRDHPLVASVAEAFQSAEIIALLEETFDASLANTFLRAEYAQDVDGFWLEPHSDLGVKKFTLLLYLSDDPRHTTLGTDIYDGNKTHVGSSPFARNTGMIFIPSDKTIHGFERRTIQGVRKSLIVNYVTDEWRARDQLAFPGSPIEFRPTQSR